MHDARGVHGGQRSGEPGGQAGQRGTGQRSLGRDDVLKCLARHVPGHDIGVVPGQVRVQDLGHVRAADPAHGLDFVRETPPGSLIGGHALPQNLDRYLPLGSVAGQVDHAHAALTQLLSQAVRAESLIPGVGAHSHKAYDALGPMAPRHSRTAATAR